MFRFSVVWSCQIVWHTKTQKNKSEPFFIGHTVQVSRGIRNPLGWGYLRRLYKWSMFESLSIVTLYKVFSRKLYTLGCPVVSGILRAAHVFANTNAFSHPPHQDVNWGSLCDGFAVWMGKKWKRPMSYYMPVLLMERWVVAALFWDYTQLTPRSTYL